VLRWQHGKDAELACVPALGIVVVAARADELEARLPQEIRLAFSRGRSTLTLRQLVDWQRAVQVRVEQHTVYVKLPNPKQPALAAEREAEQTKSVLPQVATNLTHAAGGATHGLGEVVAQLAELLTGRRPRSMLLVGPSGVGKTAAVRELVRRRATLNLGA